MVRYASFARDNMSMFKVAWANWYGNEQTPGGANVTTITASIEYPAGTFTQMKFGGNATGTAPAGTTLLSDNITVAIPNGAQFWVRHFITNSFSLQYLPGYPNNALGDATTQGGTDQTMGGTVLNTANILIPTLAIIGMTSKRAVAVIGDSRQAGTGDDYQAANGSWGEMPTGLNQYAWIDLGLPSDQSAQYLSTAGPLRAQLIGYCSDVVNAYGTNDLFVAAKTAAQLKTSQTAIAALYPTKKLWLTTIDPETSSTDSWATLGNQTVFGNEAARVTYNTDVRGGNVPGYLGYFDAAAVSESALNSGKWKVDGTANKYTVDGIHQSAFCYRLYSFTLP